MAIRRKRPTRRSVSRGRRKVSRPWSRSECAFMRKYYRNHETKWCARQLGRTVYAVRYKAVDMSIKKSKPSVWKGNKGPKTAFKRLGGSRTTAGRKSTARRRPTRRAGYRSTARRRTTRKSSARRKRR